MVEPDACDCERCMPPRPMTGILATMTPEQIERAFAYDGPINHGDPRFLRPRTGLYDALGRN